MEFWLVSPNIDMKGGKTLEWWKEIILNHKAVFMGWPPKRTRDGAQRLGQIFAGAVEGAVRWGDLILSAYREDGRWHAVGCGRVNSTAHRNLKLSDGLGYQRCRELKPFVPLQDAGFSFKGTTPDGQDPAHRRRVVPALVKFKPESNSADELLLDKLVRLLKIPPSPNDLARTPLGEDEYLWASRSQRKVIVPRHKRLSNAFADWLEQRGYLRVRQEYGRVDLDFVDGDASCRAELKVCYGVNTRQAIREALGQLLEYNYYPRANREPAEKWFVVLDERPTGTDMMFLRRLHTTMKFPLSVCWRSGNSFKMQRC